ncbi:T-cell activation Rho GTPase-activating protein isoform X3 [Pelodiscus sinensis]|uniref:T-cell activation Rho GTPase-activating protein isoform X3 n=1 Tax=Pelodiscus sinensis TaxID=13735 RepID=UPI003F6A6F90
MSGPRTQRKVRRGSYNSNITTKNLQLKNLAHRRGSAPSLAFGKALSKPWSSSPRDSLGYPVSIEECPFVLGLTRENSKLILNDCVQLTQDTKTKEIHLFLFTDSLIIAKLNSLEVKELWLDTILWQTKETKETRITKVPSTKFLMKVLGSCNAPKPLNINNMESLIECQSEGDIKKCHLMVSCDSEDGLCHLIDGNKKRKKVISWPFALRWNSTASESSGHLEPDLKTSLFDQPLSIVCGEDDTLPKPIQDILTTLYLKGPFTEGIFRKAANEKARKELKEELNSGGKVDLKSKPVHLLAVVFKDFLRNIPHKLLSSELYDEWMTAMEKQSNPDRIEGLKEVADKLPRPNLLLLKHLVFVLHHLSKTSDVNRMDSSNLAICIGPNLLTPKQDETLPLEVQKQLNDKVKTLVAFLIDNYFEIFGEDISLLFSPSADDSLEYTDSSTELLSPTQQNDSAYDSTDPEAECSSSISEIKPLQKATGRTASLRCRETQCQKPQGLPAFASSLTVFKKSISTQDRRYSEPDMSLKDSLEGKIRSQKLTKSEDNFTIQQEQLGLQGQELEKQLPGQFFPGSRYRNKKPPHLSVKTNLPSELSSGSLPKTSSSCSLDSSLSNSDCSVFTSSPLVSPSSPKRTFLTRPQSFSTKTADEIANPNREIKKHSMSFSVVSKKVLTKTQSWEPGKTMCFQRSSFKQNSKKENQFLRRTVEEPCTINSKQLPVVPQTRSSFRSADEVFREVDQKNPGKPPSYEEATKNCLAAKVPSYSSLTVQNMRATVSKQDSFSPHPCLSNGGVTTEALPCDRHFVVNDSRGQTETIDIAVNSRVSLPVTPGVYRLRTMSESYQKNKQECLIRRCSQPVFEIDQIKYAKESYV